MSVYYNDNDLFACAWLLELMWAGALPDGDVDGRSVVEVTDVGFFRQCHFFAGIGGWAHALRLAQWPEDREIWTASLPCQPFSVAGQGQGDADERHLWPAFHRLVAKHRPATIVGEQVASSLGREWFAGVRLDLERAGYACGAVIMPACAVGAPHRRERLYWCGVADAISSGLEKQRGDAGISCGAPQSIARQAVVGADASGFWDDAEWRIGADGKARRVKSGIRLLVNGATNRVGLLRGFGNAIVPQVAAQFIRAIM